MKTSRRALAAAAAIVGACSLAACAETRAGADPEPGAGGALTVTRGEVAPALLLSGELKAADAIALIAPNANIWPLQIRWIAQDGAVVAAGDVVAEFDNTQLLSNLEEMEVQELEAANRLLSEQARVASEVDDAAFEVERLRAELAKARLEAAVPPEILSRRKLEEYQLELRRAELRFAGAERKLRTTREAGDADVELQRIALAKASDAVDRARSSIDQLTLTAPRGGVLVVAENDDEGRPLRPGDQAWPGNEVAQLPDLETLEVEARLFDVDDERVRPGQGVRAWLDAFPDREIGGRVREVEEIADQADRFSLRRFFRVRVTLDAVDVERMRPGMSVKVLAAEPPLADVVRIPREAIDWSGEAPRAVLADGSRAPVELGRCDAFHCAALGGLEPGTALAPAEDGR
ncbi:MAG TPA: efflux RND transporter periplasmic adaptor subunit [Thermoanaerobaculia bacterium]